MSITDLPPHINQNLASLVGLSGYATLQQTNTSLYQDCNSTEFTQNLIQVIPTQDVSYRIALIHWLYRKLQDSKGHTLLTQIILSSLVNLVQRNRDCRQELANTRIYLFINDQLDLNLTVEKGNWLFLLLSELVLEKTFRAELNQVVCQRLFTVAINHPQKSQLRKSVLTFIKKWNKYPLCQSQSRIMLITGGVDYSWNCLWDIAETPLIHQDAIMALWSLYHRSVSIRGDFFQQYWAMKRLRLVVKRGHQYFDKPNFVWGCQSLLYILCSGLPIGSGTSSLSYRDLCNYYNSEVANLCELQLTQLVKSTLHQRENNNCQASFNRNAPVILHLYDHISPQQVTQGEFLQSLVTIVQHRIGNINIYNWLVGVVGKLKEDPVNHDALQRLGFPTELYSLYLELLSQSNNQLLLQPISNLLMSW